MSILFVGRRNLGGSQMRGQNVAMRMGATFADWDTLPDGKWDTVVCIKYWMPQIRELRKRTKRLLMDPLDVWSQTRPQEKPTPFWAWVKAETQCDLMLATSPAAEAGMREAGIETVLAPHHADERIGRDWYNPTGPVVYAGGERFLGREAGAIKAACKNLGRDFVCRYDKECWQALKGAALVLSVRYGKERTPLNVWAKPAVKVANAARAGIPVLATNDPAIYTLCPVPLTDGLDWETDIAKALQADAPVYPWTLDTHCDLLRRLAG